VKKIILLLFTLCIFGNTLKAQVNVDTPNLSFKEGFKNWKLEEGNYCYDSISNSYVYGDWKVVSSQTTRRFLILNNASTTTDTILVCSNLKTNPDGNPVARIGAPLKTEGYNTLNKKAAAERLTYEFIVTPNSTLLTYKLAAVLNSPITDNHLGSQRPGYRVDINAYDSNGAIATPAPSCTRFEVLADTANHNLERSLVCNSSVAGKNVKNYVYQNWITGNVDLSNYVGYKVIITITTKDCLLDKSSTETNVAGNHEAYGYFWAETRKIALDAFSCTDSVAQIKAPGGFTTYKWTRSDKIPISSTAEEITIDKTLNINGIKYTCEMINANSMCGSISTSQIVKQVQINPAFSSITTDAGKIEFTDKSTASGDSIVSYYWDFGDGKAGSIDRNPTHQYTEYKTFVVKLKVTTSKGCNQLFSQLVTPTRKLTIELVPTDTTLYNGRPKDYRAINMNITGLVQDREYYLVYINQKDTTKKSFSAPSSVGDYVVRFELSPLVAYKYKMDSVPFKKFSVTPAPLTVFVNNLTKTYGEKITLQIGGFTLSMNPLYAGDIIKSLELSCNGLADTASVGTYPITPIKAIGLGVDNYNISFVPGTLAVSQKQLIINIIDNTKTYGDVISATGKEFYIAPHTFVGNDTVIAVSLQCNGFNKLSTAGTYPIKAMNAIGVRLSNYKIGYTDATLVVNKKQITVTAKALNKVYGNNYTFTGKEFDTDLTQFIGSDSISHIQFTSLATPQKTAVGEYNLSIVDIAGNGLENYDIKQVNNKFKVTPMDITITPKNLSKEYGDLLLFNGNEFSTDKLMVAGDTISFVQLKSSGNIQTAPIGEYDIMGSLAYGAGTLNYNISYALGKLNVVKKKLVATIFPPTYLGYNAQTKDFSTNVSVSGMLQNADYYIRYTSRAGTSTYNSLTAPTTVGDYTATFELSPASSLKYYTTATIAADFTITKAPLTITADDCSKTYGDNLNLIKTAFKSDMKPLFGSDQIYQLDMECNGLIDTASVGTYSITPVKVTAGSGMENYLISFVAGKLTVSPKPLLLKALDANKTYGDLYTPTGAEFYVDSRTFVGTDTVTSVKLTSGGCGATVTVGSYPIEISNAKGRRLNNYQISYSSANLLISKKKITVAAKTLTKIYGNEYSFNGKEFDTDFSQLVGKDTISSLLMTSPATPKKASVGDYNISITKINGKGLENYDIKLANNIFRINPMAITITANNVSKEYGSLQTFNGSEFSTNNTLVAGDTISFVMLKSSGCAQSASIGDYDIFASQAYGAGTMNYDFTYLSGKLTIVRKKITATIFPPTFLGYNGQNKEFSATLSISGLIQNSHYFIRYTNRTGTPAYNSLTAPAAAGDYTATFVLSSQSELTYFMDAAPSTDFTIPKAPLTITANNASKTYGYNLNLLKDAFKTDLKPLYGSDKVFEVEMSCKGLNDTTSVGTYPITPTKAIGNGVENYDIHFEAGMLTVSPKALWIKAVDATKIYGDKTTPIGSEFYVDKQNLVGSDGVTSITLTSAGYEQLATVGTYSLKASSAIGNRLNNYQITYSDATLLVVKKKITVSAKPVSKVYGSEYLFRGNEFATDSSQLVGTDKIYSVKLNSQASQKKASVGQYNLTITDVVGFRLDNYDIKMVSNLFEVTPMPLIVQAKNLEKEYSDVLTFDGNEFSTNIPLVNGDTISYVFMHSNGCAETSPIGEYDIIPSQSFGSGSMNYKISYRNGKLKVIQKQLKVTALNCVKEYGENDPELKFSVIDKRGVEYLPSLFSGKVVRQPNELVGTYPILQGTLTINPSYSFTFTQGQLTIKKARPLIDPFFTNEGGQYIVSNVSGTKNGDAPQGYLKLKISQAIDKSTGLVNGRSICQVSKLPTQMVVAELEYQGDNNYLPATKTLNIYAIVYETNGGALASPITNFDGSESVTLETPSHNLNYKFNGWYETPDFSGDPIKRIPIGVTHDVHLYAKWSVTYEDLAIVPLFNQVLAVANPMNRDFIYKSTYKWYKNGIQLAGNKQYCGFENYIPSGLYRVEIYYMNNSPIVIELNHQATVPMSKVYPNPLSKNADLTLSTELVKDESVTVEVFNAIGIRQPIVKVQRHEDSFELNGFVNAGMYIIRVIQNGQIKETHKVIVEN
jgi:uncharacterized repeat protein (TIGR02543 family)